MILSKHTHIAVSVELVVAADAVVAWIIVHSHQQIKIILIQDLKMFTITHQAASN